MTIPSEASRTGLQYEKPSQGAGFLAVAPNANPSLTISPGGKALVTIHADGSLEYGEGYTPDAAARTFWEAMGHHRPLNGLTRVQQAAPDMLEVLRAVEAAYDSDLGGQDQLARQMENVRAAIGKATGARTDDATTLPQGE